jgi:glycosyl transferase family 25
LLPIFLINLDRSPDRLASMQAQADALGFSFERISAVDGRKIPAWLNSEFSNSARMSDGAVGCYASHLLAAHTIVGRQLPYALVMEDDAQLSPDFLSVAERAVSCAPLGWDYLHISSRFKKTVIKVADIDAHHALVRYVLPPCGTAGYVLSNSGARKWLAPMDRVRPNDLDNRFAWQQRLKIYGVYPAIVSQNLERPSTIGRAKIRPHWEPSAVEQLRGLLWTVREIGLGNYLSAKARDAANSMRKRMGRAARIDVI